MRVGEERPSLTRCLMQLRPETTRVWRAEPSKPSNRSVVDAWPIVRLAAQCGRLLLAGIIG
jgi:hypothetical protein